MPHQYQLHLAYADGQPGLTLFAGAEDDGARLVARLRHPPSTVAAA